MAQAEYVEYVEICGLRLAINRNECVVSVRKNGHWTEVVRGSPRDLATHEVSGTGLRLMLEHAAVQRALADGGAVRPHIHRFVNDVCECGERDD